jgi:hypothetical protein
MPRRLDGSYGAVSTLATAAGPVVQNGDLIQLLVTSTDASATIRFEGRLLTLDGEINPWLQDMIITGAGVQTPINVPLTNGWIIGFSVYVHTGTITVDEVEASVHVIRNTGNLVNRVMCLASGDLTNAKSLGLGAFT